MKRLLLHFGLAALTFALGVAAAYVPRAVGVLTVSDADAPAPHMKFCEVHGTAMLLERVPVRRGPGLVTSLSHLNAQERLFPHANRFVEEGGCEHLKKQPDVLVYACLRCRVIQASWVEFMGGPLYGNWTCGVY